jgi:hypothetical protein
MVALDLAGRSRRLDEGATANGNRYNSIRPIKFHIGPSPAFDEDIYF